MRTDTWFTDTAHEALAYRPMDRTNTLPDRHEFPAMAQKLLRNLGVAGGSSSSQPQRSPDDTVVRAGFRLTPEAAAEQKGQQREAEARAKGGAGAGPAAAAAAAAGGAGEARGGDPPGRAGPARGGAKAHERKCDKCGKVQERWGMQGGVRWAPGAFIKCWWCGMGSCAEGTFH